MPPAVIEEQEQPPLALAAGNSDSEFARLLAPIILMMIQRVCFDLILEEKVQWWCLVKISLIRYSINWGQTSNPFSFTLSTFSSIFFFFTLLSWPWFAIRFYSQWILIFERLNFFEFHEFVKDLDLYIYLICRLDSDLWGSREREEKRR